MDNRVFNPDGTITTIIPAREWTDPITGVKETIPEKKIKTYTPKDILQDN